ncbi:MULTISPECIES: MarR family winged helix-turn-helix transcriptional regulator [Dyella]|uniref:MarR family winged helix-turn-helix transcriptional regulator n=2 Tax=Dyella TaxID=231454 RepID=UPI001FBAFEA8|nr:MarR family transcriptional regulator [Dyella sp. SG562]
MNPANPPMQESIGMLLAAVRTEIVRAMETELAARGIELRFTQFLILKRLSALGPMTAGELARSIELDGGAMTRQLDQLEGKGYLRRRPHEQDRRALRIELTDEGQAMTQELINCNDRVVKAAQVSLDETERQQLRDYLTRVLHALRDRH